MADPRYAEAARIASGSWILSRCERGFELAGVAWRASATRAKCAVILRLPHVDLVRLAGYAALSATLMHMFLVGIHGLLKPPTVGLPWIVVIPLALVCIHRPAAVLTALRRRH